MSAIADFHQEKEYADRILEQHGSGMKSLVLFELSKYPGYMYGQNNFHLFPDDEYNWKFIRTFDEFIDHDFFHQVESKFGHCFERVLFIDETLKARFERHSDTRPYKHLFSLVSSE
jgi:hypothetical protein